MKYGVLRATAAQGFVPKKTRAIGHGYTNGTRASVAPAERNPPTSTVCAVVLGVGIG